MNADAASQKAKATLALAALGVVYGDIGTSPLYALRECFSGEHGIAVKPANILGVLSLIFWSLLLIVSLKYLAISLRATNKGEGGILALMALALPHRGGQLNARTKVMLALGVFGAALLYGDGIITPAITVLGAVEGLHVATPVFDKWVVPIAVIILVAVFSVQFKGTAKVGMVFGPVMVVWFMVLALLGIRGILRAPEVLRSINPYYGLQFLLSGGWTGFVVLGAVFLVVTGGEALYADVGHFGTGAVRLAWFAMVLPGLFLNYLGQGALLLTQPETAANPFFFLAPKWALLPLVVLATAAAVIASQALITGAYSLTMQAVQLGYLPRVEIRHTSSTTRGQIYLPHVNWVLMLACIGLVLGFRSSSNLAAAYGIAVTLTMLITTGLFFVTAHDIWHWPLWKALLICGLFFVIEFAFFGANCVKIAHGGWFPLAVGALIFTAMATWKTGRALVGRRLQAASMPLDLFLKDVKGNEPHRVPGTAIFMAGNLSGTPVALLHNLKHNKVLHKCNILLTVVTDDVPKVEASSRLESEEFGEGFYRVIGHYGFMEEPDVPALLAAVRIEGRELDLQQTTFFLSRENIVPTEKPGMAMWREHLFAAMSRNAQSATQFFNLPANRVVELGMHVEM